MVKAQSYKPVHLNKVKNGKPFSKGQKKKSIAKKSLVHYNVNKIQNKIKRNELLEKRKMEIKKLKRRERKQNKNVPEEEKKLPLTIDDKREIDENFILHDAYEDEELQNEEEMDEFNEFFKGDKAPKLMMTTSIRPQRQMFDFLKDIKPIFGCECHYWPRKKFNVQQIQEYAINQGYTDLLVFREDKHQVNELIMIHLPEGPTAIFKISNIKLSHEIRHHGRITDHFPELILNNFNTKVGRRIGRFFSVLFPQNPEFKGRRVVTFHNQRDFIFFRHHRYIFQEDGEKAALQEIGPQFTLKLKRLQLGKFDNLKGEIEFESKDDMYVSRKRVYI